MDKFEEMALLLDFYGELLTDKQKDVMNQYYSYDLSLQEIADNEKISKQGVHDLIRRSEHTLRKTDEKLGFLNRLSDIRIGLEKVSEGLDNLAGAPQKRTADGIRKADGTGTGGMDGQENGSAWETVLDACRQEIARLKNRCMGG